MKKKSNFIWRVIFILLLIANALFVSWALNVISGPVYGADLRGIALASLSLPLLIIDFIAIFTYILKQHPHGIISKSISSISLIVVCFMLTYFALPFIAFILDVKLFQNFGTAVIPPFNVTPFVLVDPPSHIGVAILSTFPIIVFLSKKFHK